jgi:hypothetical protein
VAPAEAGEAPTAPAEQGGEKKGGKADRLTDAGEELIRNRRGKLKGLAWDDVSAMNDTLKVAQVVKGNVWPRPDYAKLVDDGMPAWKAAMLKAVYDSLAAAPKTTTTPTDADLKAYIQTMGEVREALMAELDRVQEQGSDGTDLWKTLKSANVFGKVFPVPADARPIYGAPSPFDRNSEQGKANNKRALLIGGNSAVHALQFGYKAMSKAKDLLADGFPAKQEAWQKSYEVRQTETRDNDVPEAERTGQPQQRFYVYEKGSRWRLAKGGQDGGYGSQEAAEAFARSLVVRKKELLPPSRGLDLADAHRDGPDWRGGKSVTAQDIMDRFGFRGVNLGEYVKAKQGMAQLHLNHVFDSFSDLADLLGVPPMAMSLNGTLGVAVGAQGSGKALAHFVPGVNEINITRDSGAGALAHEFGHAVDHYFATQHGRAASMSKRPYLSAAVEAIRDPGGVRPEVIEAMRAVMKTLNSRPMTQAEARKYIADQRDLNQRRLDRWVKEFKGNKGADAAALDAVADKLKRGDIGEPQDTDIETNIAEFMRAAGLKPGNAIAANAVTLAYRLNNLADEAAFMATHIPQVDTDYAKASKAMDAKKQNDPYWSSPWEMFARAFETFAMDALADRQRQNLYLSGLVDSAGWRNWAAETGKSIPYPAGDERLAMQQAFQTLVDTIETRADDAGNVAMYSRRRSTAGISMRDAEAIKAAVHAALPNAPEIVLHDAVGKAPHDLLVQIRAEGAQDDIEAVYWNGKIHVFPAHIASIERAEFVIGRHEIRHHGMRTRYGARLDEVLMSMWRANPGLRQAAQAIVDSGRAKRNERVKAVEEALADMPVERIAQLRQFDKLVAAVRQWLRQMAVSLRRRGYAALADAIDPKTWTDNDVAAFVFRAEAMSGEAGRLGGPVNAGEARASRSKVAPVTGSFQPRLAGLPGIQGRADILAPTDPDPDIRFSRATDAVAMLGRIDQRAVRNAVNDLMSSPGKVSWWEKSIGTQYAKAERYAKHADTAGFKTVFDAVQDYHEDISTLANEAASAAPSVLPRLDGWRDLAKSGLSTADAKAVAAPVFAGTLEWARDADGRLVKIDDLEAAAEKMDVHDKAHALFAAGRITERVLKMWQGLPIEQFETIITGKYEREFLQAGAVFTPDELRAHFKLTDRQISHYQQIRAAIDTSLDQAATADVLRLLKDAPQDFKRMAMEDRAAFRRAVLEFLDTQEGADDLRADIQDKFDRIDSLKAHGYAPLMRFGKFYVDVKDQGTGESLYFGLYESRREANAALRDMREAFPEGVASAGVISQQQHKLFSGIPLESLEMFAQAIGAEQSDVYQQYIKLAKNNRSAMKRLLKRKGTAGFNDNPTRVLAAFLTSNARLASGSMNLLSASQAAQEIRAGDVKDEAIKLLEAVQNPTETAAALRGFMFVNFIGGSVASAVVNLTQTVTMTLPYLTQWGGLAKATGHWSAALRMAANKVDVSTELGKALKQAEADGIVSPQEIHHLQAEAMGSWGTNPALKKAAFVWGSMFGLAEQFNRRVTFIAAYQTAREQNMADPFAFAEKAVVETQGLYNRGNSANWARNPVGAAALQFKQFTVHYLEWLQRMWQSGPQGKRAVGYALAVLLLAAGSGGLPGSDDLDDLIDTLAQALGYDFSSKAAKEQFLASMLGKAGAEFVTRGISGVAGMPIDVSLRMGMGNLIPATGLLLRSNTDSARDLSEVAGAAGGLFRQVKDASSKALAGDFTGAAIKAAPMAIQNAAKGVQIWTTGEYRDERGRRVMDATMVDGLMKFIGFQPAEVAAETDKLRQDKRSEDFAKKVESEIVGKWARGLVDGEPDAVRDAQEELRRWNEKNPGTPIRINRAQIAQRARKMRETRAERFSKTVAPERRQLVAQ